jgi:hypothetical protein
MDSRPAESPAALCPFLGKDSKMQTRKRLTPVVGLVAVLTWGAPASAYTIDYTVAISGEDHLAGNPPGSFDTLVASGIARLNSDAQALTMTTSAYVYFHSSPFVGGVIQVDRTVAFHGTEVASALTGVSASLLSWAATSIAAPNPCATTACLPPADLSHWVISDIPLSGGSVVIVGSESGMEFTASYTLTPIPEPGTLLLVAFGLAGLSVRRCRD